MQIHYCHLWNADFPLQIYLPYMFFFPDIVGFLFYWYVWIFLIFRNDLLFFVPDIKKAILTNHWNEKYNYEFLNIKNAQNRNRTSDTRIFSPLLYQLSYLGIDLILNKSSSGDRIWTYDLRVMSPTSFQTAPSRDMKLIISIEIKPMIGLEPITCWLQISCSANWATSAQAFRLMGGGGFEPPKH